MLNSPTLSTLDIQGPYSQSPFVFLLNSPTLDIQGPGKFELAGSRPGSPGDLGKSY
jgi:hypothetical protein